MNNETVCAVVVTYNRKKLLIECLKALENQTRPVDAIYIIDNASTDGTPELLLENKYLQELPPKELKENFEKTIKKDNTIIHYLKMPENTGGAGGFHEGVKNACDQGYDWLWIMDDDTIVHENSLEKLVGKIGIVEEPVGFACSKIMWKGEIHLQNMPFIQNFNSFHIPFNKYDQDGILSVEFCTFVSCLVNKNAVKIVGLPIKEFFIWGDDIEYTKRIINNGFLGLYVADSVVNHETKYNSDGSIESIKKRDIWKNFYGRRNELYMRKSDSYIMFFVYFIKYLTIYNVKIILYAPEDKIGFLWINTKATFASLLFNPKVVFL